MSFMQKIFGQPPTQQPAATPAANPATPTQPGNLPAEPISMEPAQPTVEPVAPVTPDSPLAEFANLWDNPTNPETPDAPIVTQLDPAKLNEVIAKADFSGNVSQEHLAAISAGGDGAQQAFTEAMNAMARQVMVQSTLAANKMLDQTVTKLQSGQEKQVSELMRKHTTANTLVEANPLYSDPAVKPVLEAVQSQLAVKNPTATPAQLAEMAQNFVKVMGESFNPTAAPDVNNPQADLQDWDKFMT